MSTMMHDLVVGAVGVGPAFADGETIETLRAENRRLTRCNHNLAHALTLCATLTEEASNAKHEALLEHNEYGR